jgi:hypothetical protein
MTEAGEAEEAQGTSPEPLTYSKQLKLRKGEADAMLVEMAQWTRLKKRVKDLEGRWSIDWLTAGSAGAASVALGAVIAALVLPRGAQSGIGDEVEPALWILAVLSLFAAIGMAYLSHLARDERKLSGADIVDEMNTIEKAWKQREALEKAGTNGT